jgi:hypothetical protein
LREKGAETCKKTRKIKASLPLRATPKPWVAGSESSCPCQKERDGFSRLFLFVMCIVFSNSNTEGDGNKWIFKGELSASETYTLTIDGNTVKDKYKAYTAKYAIEKVV